jgi:hypothetical protein
MELDKGGEEARTRVRWVRASNKGRGKGLMTEQMMWQDCDAEGR